MNAERAVPNFRMGRVVSISKAGLVSVVHKALENPEEVPRALKPGLCFLALLDGVLKWLGSLCSYYQCGGGRTTSSEGFVPNIAVGSKHFQSAFAGGPGDSLSSLRR
jgi:hypothetical protein